jgi:23S rRNA (uridine2552-2'-O)-methyltransferase
MGKRWLRDRKRDYYYRKAKAQNYRSRAAFKLQQINERFSVVREGDAVLDLGASPGGWSQVARELVGDYGLVVAVDLKPAKEIPGVAFIRGDARSGEVQAEARAVLASAGRGSFDLMVSDMSPNISGNYDLDQARSVELCETVLAIAETMLRPGGRLVMKVFEGDLFKTLVEEVRARFASVRMHGPRASRPSSSEIYVVAKGFKPGVSSRRQRDAAPSGST